MQYKTNQLDKEVLFSFENYKNITQDFWVYKFVTTNPSYQYSLIDDIKQDLSNVKAVVYLQGKAFYALFEKSKFKNEFELENQIQKITKNSEEVKPTLITNLRDENEIDKRHLAQLLLNTLANTSNTENAKSSNITGGLYWIVSTENSKDEHKKPYISKYATLKIELDYHLHLQLGVETFTSIYLKKYMNFKKTKFEQLPKYEIISDNIRTMRRIKFSSKDENKTNIYIQRLVGKKSTVSFLDFSNYENFICSKSGVLYEFWKEVKTQLNKYITIKFIELPFNEEKIEFDKQLSKSVKTRIENFYRSKPIVINIAKSLENDEKAINLAKNLYSFLTDKDRDYKAPNVNLGDLQKDAINIRVIRNKDFYDGQNDEYFKDKDYLVHHITTDDFSIKLEKSEKQETKKTLSSPAIDVILKESYIKNDIMQGKITILDWTFGEWIFMDRKDTTFRALKVYSNGNLSFENCLENHTFKNENYEKYKTTFQQFDKFNGREFLNCLLVSNNQDVNLIFETPRFTIQEIETIGKTLEAENKDDDNYLEKDNIIAITNKFFKSNFFKENDKESIDALITLLEKYKSNFSKKELLNLFGKEKANLSNKGENHLQYRFCKFYQEQTEDVLKTFFRGKSDKEELLGSRLDIFYQINNNQTEALYFVGEKSEGINSSFENATNIRKIKAVNLQGQPKSKLVFDQLLETMAVDFVKQGNLTVVPFPFKYLRESRQ